MTNYEGIVAEIKLEFVRQEHCRTELDKFVRRVIELRKNYEMFILNF